jgi:hypothetical protein
VRITRETQRAIAEAVWLDRFDSLDGLNTAAVAEKFGISTTQAYRELIKILKGECSLFPFQYRSEDDGVIVSTGRIFVRNSECHKNDNQIAHSYWFYT